MELGQKLAQTGNQNFPAHDDDDRNVSQRRHQLVGNHDNQRRHDQQFVGNRVKQPSEHRILIAGTGKITVKIIGNRSRYEQRAGQNRPQDGMNINRKENDRDHHNPGNRQNIGKI